MLTEEARHPVAPRRRIVVVGGGTAGWMTAAALVRMLGSATTAITLIESEEIATIGVGEATIPPIVAFNRLLGIDEQEFVRETQATAKLGIEFVDWHSLGHRYFHPFGRYGSDIDGMAFTHYWLRARALGLKLPIDAFSVEALAARAGKFVQPHGDRAGRPAYAYHFDAGLYANFLRNYAEARGVERIEGKIVVVDRTADGDMIDTVRLADGRMITGDFFVDCSGFRALLVGDTLGEPYDDWSRWLPVNRAIAVPSRRMPTLKPLTRSTARDAGWQWRIPLQHRTGNGYIFCDAFCDEAAATDAILRDLGDHAIAEPRTLRFTTGCRRRQWIGNCVAIGLAAGFLEPLESTSIHLTQAAISKLLAFLPTSNHDRVLSDRFNREMLDLFEGVRDFLIAHYLQTQREDTPFWRHCQALPISDSLEEKLASFATRGEVIPAHQDLFRDSSWFAVLHGQGIEPSAYHPIVDAMGETDLRTRIDATYRQTGARVSALS